VNQRTDAPCRKLQIELLGDFMKTMPGVLLALMLYGCQNMDARDDREWTHVTCSGASDWAACWRQAEKICPNGFDRANQQEDRSALKREIDIACKQ
jgi:hypothetical protein